MYIEELMSIAQARFNAQRRILLEPESYEKALETAEKAVKEFERKITHLSENIAIEHNGYGGSPTNVIYIDPTYPIRVEIGKVDWQNGKFKFYREPDFAYVPFVRDIPAGALVIEFGNSCPQCGSELRPDSYQCPACGYGV